MDNLLNETKFEEHIAGYLAGSDLYNQRSSSQFDIEKLCDVEMLEQFLRQQPVVWNKLTKHFSGQEVATVIREYNKRIDRGESILTIMRKGFTISGAKVKFCQFKPVLEVRERITTGCIVPTGSAWSVRCVILWARTVAMNWTCASCSMVFLYLPSS